MNFGVEIRHKPTGRAVTLFGKQAVADFLAGVDASQWEGYACLGELPAPTPVTTGEFALDAEALSVLDAEYQIPAGPQAEAALDVAMAEDHSDTTLVVGDTFADKTVAVGDSGKGDSYLPADTAGEQE